MSVVKALRPMRHEAPLSRRDAWPLAGVVVAGGVLGPVLLLVGLGRTSGTAAALLLNLEAPLTVLIAVALFREHLGKYGAAATVCVLLGAGALKLRPGEVSADTLGVVAIAAACACWAIDNNLTQRLSLKDPVSLVRIKTLSAGTFNLCLGIGLGGKVPEVLVIAGALGLGAVSYGVSVLLDAYALRLLGAAREAAYFATAPFLGAVGSMLLLGERPSWVDGAAMASMALGVFFLLRDRHAHEHVHEPLEHEHAHSHDEHHQHEHAPGTDPTEPHNHVHRHERLGHEHPHLPDAHHRHRH
jgi:drug/metabolite transporter (DMT)-like permease